MARSKGAAAEKRDLEAGSRVPRDTVPPPPPPEEDQDVVRPLARRSPRVRARAEERVRRDVHRISGLFRAGDFEKAEAELARVLRGH